jgi:hypothetical protein
MNSTVLMCMVVVTMSLSGGCATLPKEAKEISIQQALGELGTGLKQMRENIGSSKTGLMPSEAEVTFKLTASGKNSGGLALDLTPSESYTKAIAPELKGSIAIERLAEKANTITIKFKSIAFGKKTSTTTVETEKEKTVKAVVEEGLVDPATLAKVLEALKDAGYDPMFLPQDAEPSN